MNAPPLSVEAVGTDAIVVTRAFAAPRALVYRAFTDASLVPRWLGTPHFPMTACTIDLQTGGAFRYVWGAEPGPTMGLTGTFVTLEPPDRIVHTEIFDEDWTGGETTVTTTFEERDGKTLMRLEIRYRSEAARDAVLRSPMQDGLATNFTNLDGLLEAAPAL